MSRVPLKDMQALLERATYNDDYGIHGSCFTVCRICECDRLPEGGVQTSASRWLCAKCWTHFTQKKTRA